MSRSLSTRGEGGAIPACIAGGIPAWFAAGLGGGGGIPACLAGFQAHTQRRSWVGSGQGGISSLTLGGSAPRGVPAPGGACSGDVCGETPPWQLLLWAVHILLECILVSYCACPGPCPILRLVQCVLAITFSLALYSTPDLGSVKHEFEFMYALGVAQYILNDLLRNPWVLCLCIPPYEYCNTGAHKNATPVINKWHRRGSVSQGVLFVEPNCPLSGPIMRIVCS